MSWKIKLLQKAHQKWQGQSMESKADFTISLCYRGKRFEG